MPPKAAAEKKPASKAPASKAPAEKKEASKKTAASGDKKKRTKSRKETYSSYIYKGEPHLHFKVASFLGSKHSARPKDISIGPLPPSTSFESCLESSSLIGAC
jgi:hypothetical protein